MFTQIPLWVLPVVKYASLYMEAAVRYGPCWSNNGPKQNDKGWSLSRN